MTDTEHIEYTGYAVTTIAHMAEIYDPDWVVTSWKGHGDADKQTVTITLRKRKGVPQVYREGIAGHSHANWMVEGGYVDEQV